MPIPKLLIRSEERKMQVFIKMIPENKTLIIDAEASDEIGVVKSRIYQQLNLNPEDVIDCRLFYAGKDLENSRTLSDYNISKEEASLKMRLTSRNKSIFEHVSSLASRISFWGNNSQPQQQGQPAMQPAAVIAPAVAALAPIAVVEVPAPVSNNNYPAVHSAAFVPPPAAAAPVNYKLSEKVDVDSETDVEGTKFNKPFKNK